jgi:hypothetical protein
MIPKKELLNLKEGERIVLVDPNEDARIPCKVLSVNKYSMDKVLAYEYHINKSELLEDQDVTCEIEENSIEEDGMVNGIEDDYKFHFERN